MASKQEHFDAGPPNDTQYPNKWSREEDLPGFQTLIENCYDTFQDVSLQILTAVEVGLKLVPGTLIGRCIPAAGEIRLNHYPKVSLDQGKNQADLATYRFWHCHSFISGRHRRTRARRPENPKDVCPRHFACI